MPRLAKNNNTGKFSVFEKMSKLTEQVDFDEIPAGEELDLKEIRKAAGNLSQARFASRYGFKLSTLQKWERNASSIAPPIAAYLRVIGKAPDLIYVLANGTEEKIEQVLKKLD